MSKKWFFGDMQVRPVLSKGWWKHPMFDFGIHYPAPYIWFGYWLITGWDDGWRHIQIQFMPD